MSSDNSLQEAVASLPEAIGIEKDELNIEIKDDNMIETSNDADVISSDDYELKGQESHRTISDQENVKRTRDLTDDKTGENEKWKRIKLQEIQNFDILLPNEKNYNGGKQAKKELYSGFISYRKLIDRLKPVYMKSDAPEHKLKIGRWLLGKIGERGGRFLKEDGDGTTGNCKVMAPIDSLEYTIEILEDNKPWTAIVSIIEGSEEENRSFALSSQEINIASKLHSRSHEQDMKAHTASSIPQSQTNSVDISRTDISKSERESLAIGKKDVDEHYNNIDASSEPTLKILESGATDFMGPSDLHANYDQSALKKVSEDIQSDNWSFILQGFFRERKMIRGELRINEETLLMRDERLSNLQAEFRLFQDRKSFLSSERWLTEKILRQEEIFENRELLGIQHQRCRRLRTLLELNERQLVEQQTIIGRETLELRSIGKHGLRVETRVPEMPMREMRDTCSSQDNDSEKINALESIDNENIAKARMEVEAKKQQRAARRLIEEHLALEAEINRRATLEQESAMEYEKSEIQYRQAMKDAVNRRTVMQHAMERRQFIMSEAYPSEHLSETTFRKISNISTNIQKAKPDVAKSMGDTNAIRKEVTETGYYQEISTTEGENDQGNLEESDDDYIII